MGFDSTQLQAWFQDTGLIQLSVLVTLLLLVWINRKQLKSRWLTWRSRRILNNIGLRQIYNLPCPDGLDGEYILERLAMLPHEIVLIAYKRYPGYIYCAEKISEWTQVLAQKSYKFDNPLFELNNQLTALKSIIPGIPVRGYLFFDHSADFPKGHPDSVIQVDTIPDQILRQNCAEVDERLEQAWKVLLNLSRENQSNRPVRLKT